MNACVREAESQVKMMDIYARIGRDAAHNLIAPNIQFVSQLDVRLCKLQATLARALSEQLESLNPKEYRLWLLSDRLLVARCNRGTKQYYHLKEDIPLHALSIVFDRSHTLAAAVTAVSRKAVANANKNWALPFGPRSSTARTSRMWTRKSSAGGDNAERTPISGATVLIHGPDTHFLALFPTTKEARSFHDLITETMVRHAHGLAARMTLQMHPEDENDVSSSDQSGRDESFPSRFSRRRKGARLRQPANPAPGQVADRREQGLPAR